MPIVILLICLVASAGVLGTTWLFPLLGRLLWNSQKRDEQTEYIGGNPHTKLTPLSLAIIIPAHNEEAVLAETLESIILASACAHSLQPNLEISICVGADGCTDKTAELARKFGATVFESPNQRGKWETIELLIRKHARFEWISIVDAGAVWPQDLLVKCLPLCRLEAVLAVAPSYRNPEGGFLEGLNWLVESHFKKLEARAGGPVSLHGATMLYHRPALEAAIAKLGEKRWLNDDVVLPLMLRLQNPNGRIVYVPEIRVVESSSASPQHSQEFIRRKRMALGNLQWIKQIFPSALRSNQVVGILALRRIFRVLWAYWSILFCFAIIAIIGAFSLPALLALATAGTLALAASFCLKPRGSEALLAAAQVSLLAPYYLWAETDLPQVEWK
ncbi:MAG: glycosyltransferase [Deltaproteobacteria bacterium]|nr:glycosyltransferase [Deltaproteobacteria bacterium]